MKSFEKFPSAVSRRSFLSRTCLVTLAFTGLERFVAAHERGTGQLLLGTDLARTMDLPHGFRYAIISKAGDLMSDGFQVPGKHDGMAAFLGRDGRTILVRNHEIDAHDWTFCHRRRS